jgi:uncharacterized membrane protein YozB (DUF420 family)
MISAIILPGLGVEVKMSSSYTYITAYRRLIWPVHDKPREWMFPSEWRRGRDLKIRRDAVAFSSVLFTLALLVPLPSVLMFVRLVNQGDSQSELLLRIADEYGGAFGVASLSNIIIGLIVLWVGYIRGHRWAWCVMFVIVWVWFFPVYLWPFLPHLKNAAPVTQLIPDAIKGTGLARSLVESVLAFLLMVLALILPVKTFFLRRAAGQESRIDSNQASPI